MSTGRGDSLKPHAISLDVPPSPSAPSVHDSDLVYAVASKGLTATECLASIEMEQAPPLVQVSSSEQRLRALDVAACMATPVLPDEGNGELVQKTASKLGARAEAQLRLRYAQEITNAAARSSTLRRLSRKRSLDELDIAETLSASLDEPMRSLDSTGTTPETKRLVAAHGLLTDESQQQRNRLELPDRLEPAKPVETITLAVPDHAFLVGAPVPVPTASPLVHTVLVVAEDRGASPRDAKQADGGGDGGDTRSNVLPFRIRRPASPPSPAGAGDAQEEQQ